MDLYEEAVLSYVTASRSRFVSPQFDLPWEHDSGGSCPDFVALDFEKQTVYVIEVSSASTTTTLYKRAAERDTRWFTPIREHLSTIAPSLAGWRYRVTLFVRSDVVDAMRRKIDGWEDVSVKCLEDVVFSWRWNWKGKRVANELE